MRLASDAAFDRLLKLVEQMEPHARDEAGTLVNSLRQERLEIEQHERTLAESQAEALVNAGIMMSELEEAHLQLECARKAVEEVSRAKS